jgi:hypothetical protein
VERGGREDRGVGFGFGFFLVVLLTRWKGDGGQGMGMVWVRMRDAVFLWGPGRGGGRGVGSVEIGEKVQSKSAAREIVGAWGLGCVNRCGLRPVSSSCS